jgi:predicted Fe-Mo cluster-binding NifX family protein
MKIAITSQNRRTITDHAGVCRRFWVFRTDGGSVIHKHLVELPKEESFRHAAADEPHPLDGVQALITGGTGPGLVRRLAERGIRCIVTDEMDPRTAVTAYLAGTLVEKPAVQPAGRHRTRSRGATQSTPAINEPGPNPTDAGIEER